MNRAKPAGGRPRDKVWKHVVELEDGKYWKCKYCGRVSAGSASRIRNHLSGLGNDIAACKGVPREIREELSRLQPQKKRRRQSEEDNVVGNDVGGQDTSSRVVAIDSITPPAQVASASARVAPLQVQDPSPSSFRAGDRLSGLNSGFDSLPTEFLNGLLEQDIPSSSNNHLANARTSDVAREDDDVDSNHHMNDATSTAPPGEEPAKETGEPDVDALAAGVASVSITKSAAEEIVVDAFLKFLMCNKFSSVGPNILEDPYFRKYMKRAHKHGVPCSFLPGGSLVLEKSLFNINQKVRQYMSMVKESWNTTGCTLMAFHLNHGYKGKVFTLGQDMYVYGFYCPKGFIFVEAPDLNIYNTAFRNALEQHSPSLRYDDAMNSIFLHHSINYGAGDAHLCELSDKKLSVGRNNIPCLRHEIQGLCIDVCWRSVWAQSLINRAEAIHKHLCSRESSLNRWYLDLIMEKDEDFKKKKEYIMGKDSSCLPNFLSNFISFMLLEPELIKEISYGVRSERMYDREYLKAILDDSKFWGDEPELIKEISYGVRSERMYDRDYLKAILDDSKFWGDGRDLEQVLTMTLRIPDVLDTLVPTAGYLATAIDCVNDTLISRIHGAEAIDFWKDLESKLTGTIAERRAAASYLNPYYFVNQDVQKQTELLDKLKLEFTFDNIYIDLGWGEEEKIHQDLQMYGEICNKGYEGILDENLHPIKWWEEYGNDLPLLRKCAIEVLNQPVSCMSNQMKKHIYQLQGADDFILRLNVRMMEEFKRLGDDIYKPIDLSVLELEDDLLS